MTLRYAQNNWDLVLALATDATPPDAKSGAGAARGDPGDPAGAAVRRYAVAVMDAVDRNGLVAPWTAVPHLLALTTDPNGCCAHAAPHTCIVHAAEISVVVAA
jgi:cohesin loading factor subunit SCC2